MSRLSYYLVMLLLCISAGCYDGDQIDRLPQEQFSKKILVDASHDGGVWWFPQVGTYSPNQTHQGKALADHLRSVGFEVDELPSNALITDSILSRYDKVIRAGHYGTYLQSELEAYDRFVNRNTSLLFISEHQLQGQPDYLGDRLGINFTGIHYGNVDTYTLHEVTTGALPFYFNAGAIVSNAAADPRIQVLALLSGNPNQPVMGILNGYPSKILFLGEINGLETVPQPLTNNIIKWLFY